MAGLLPGDWNMRLCDLNVAPLGPQDWDFADIVLITGMIVQRQSQLDLIREARQRGKIVVVGGPYVTSVPDEARAAGCDILLQGECEELVPQFLEALENRQGPVTLQCQRHPDMFPVACSAFRPAAVRRLQRHQHPDITRLSVSLRILRHHQSLRTQTPL